MGPHVVPFPRTADPSQSFATQMLSCISLHAADIHTCEYEPGVVLFAEGERAKSVLVLMAGEVKLSMNATDGRRLILRIARSGESLNLPTIVSNTAYAIWADVRLRCCVLAIERESFLREVFSSRKATGLVMKELSRDYAEMCDRLQMIGSASLDARLARLLLRWSAQGRSTHQGTHICSAFSHREIGEFISAARESVTRTMADFERRGIVTVRGTAIVIRDMDRLEKLAGVAETLDRDPA